MIELYTSATSNGRRASIMLEEIGVPYHVHPINLSKGEQRQATFLALNPAHGIPVIIDRDESLAEPLVLSQSVAILLYLAEKSKQFIPENMLVRAKMFQWLLFDATDITQVRLEGSRLGWNGQDDASKLLHERVLSRYDVLEQHLSQNEYLAGDEYSIADMSAFPWASAMEFDNRPSIARWLKHVGQRPAVQRGMLIPQSEQSHEN